jgi:hypothetical protein
MEEREKKERNKFGRKRRCVLETHTDTRAHVPAHTKQQQQLMRSTTCDAAYREVNGDKRHGEREK